MRTILLSSNSTLFKALENNDGHIEIYVENELCYTVLLDTKQLIKHGFQSALKYDLVKEQQENILNLLEEEINFYLNDIE